MKYKIRHRLGVITGLLVVFAACGLAGCAEAVKVPKTLEDLSLVQMWYRVSEATNIRDKTANLDDFTLRADGEGTIESLYFTFHSVDGSGKRKGYSVGMNANNRLDWNSYDLKPLWSTRHPTKIFWGIDEVDLSSVKSGDGGMVLRVDFQSGDVGYSHGYTNIYHLKDGDLIPLEKVVFHSDIPWATIEIYELSTIDEAENNTTKVTSSTSDDNLAPAGQKTAQIWFLTEDLANADTVEYLEK
jgi:hypothetical protein